MILNRSILTVQDIQVPPVKNSMSAHYSKYLLNTYAATPYFQARMPPDYPLSLVLIKCRAFRRLPPRLRELAEKAKVWTCRVSPYPAGIEGIERWYDAAGNELDPDTGRLLTDAEIDAEWGEANPEIERFVLRDVPVLAEGSFDPATWEAPAAPADLIDRSGLHEHQVLADIVSRGREATAAEYGVPTAWLEAMTSDGELAQLILDMDGRPWPAQE